MAEIPHTHELWESTVKVAELGLQSIRARYGASGETPKDFHNDVHAIEVVESELLICTALKAPPGLRNAAVIAGVFHDYEQNLAGGDNEAASAEAAVATMRETGGFSGKFHDLVRRMIGATVVHFDGDEFFQSATQEDEMILADADMSNIGRETPYYRQRGAKLFHERYPDEPIDGEAMHEFLKKSEPVLSTHSYYLPASVHLFPHQNQNLLFAQALRRKLGKSLNIE